MLMEKLLKLNLFSWSISDTEQQKYHEELNNVMQPFIAQMQLDIQTELRKIIARLSS